MEDQAGLRISDGIAVGNHATAPRGKGGFLLATLTAPILFQRVNGGGSGAAGDEAEGSAESCALKKNMAFS